jgi:ABC-type transport system involved in multi-copper enzyme maturation permease subunit
MSTERRGARNGTLASLRAEALKLRKRPAVWVLALVWVALMALFGYLLTYVIFSNPPEGAVPPGADPDDVLKSLLPENMLSNVLRGFSGTGGGPIALILGAMVMGGEYGWGTTKTMLTQRPGRLGVFAGKVLGLVLVLLVFSVLGFATGAACSYAVATFEETAVRWPEALDVAGAVASGWLILVAWGSLGFALATLFRGTALAIGLGLVYAVVLEGIAGSLLALNEEYEGARRALISESSNALADLFGSPPEALNIPESLIDPERAILILILYSVVFVLLAAFVFWRRDVT